MSEDQAAPIGPWNWEKMRGFVLPVLGTLLVGGAFLLIAAERDNPGSLSHLEAETKSGPAKVEPMGETGLNRVILTERAAERLDIQTMPVREQELDGEQRLVIPYSAVIYGLNGETWAYISPEKLTYYRDPITVDYIEGDIVVLAAGPSVGTEVVTVGVAELYGVDTGVGQ